MCIISTETSQEAAKEQETESSPEPAQPASASKKPPEPDTEEYQVLRSTFDNNWQQLQAIIKGTNNLEPIIIHCDKDADGITDDAIKAVEGDLIISIHFDVNFDSEPKILKQI